MYVIPNILYDIIIQQRAPGINNQNRPSVRFRTKNLKCTESIMDRRRLKTRKAIFQAFLALLERKRYDHITVQEILDEADVGRSTFYAHFETKEMLLEALCSDVFFHVFEESPCAWKGDDGELEGRLTHILWHVRDSQSNLAAILASEGGEVFMDYFKRHLVALFGEYPRRLAGNLPAELRLRLLATGFAETVRWWAAGKFKESPEEVAAYFLQMFEGSHRG